VWVHDQQGDRQVSSEGFAYMPYLSADGRKLYYLVRNNSPKFMTGELWWEDLSSQQKERLFPGIPVVRYDVSDDGKQLILQGRMTAVRASGPRLSTGTLLQGNSYHPNLIVLYSLQMVKSSSHTKNSAIITYFE